MRHIQPNQRHSNCWSYTKDYCWHIYQDHCWRIENVYYRKRRYNNEGQNCADGGLNWSRLLFCGSVFVCLVNTEFYDVCVDYIFSCLVPFYFFTHQPCGRFEHVIIVDDFFMVSNFDNCHLLLLGIPFFLLFILYAMRKNSNLSSGIFWESIFPSLIPAWTFAILVVRDIHTLALVPYIIYNC